MIKMSLEKIHVSRYLPTINSNDARRHVQTSLILVLDVLEQLDITKPDVDIEVAASQRRKRERGSSWVSVPGIGMLTCGRDNTPRNITDWLRGHNLKPTKVHMGDRWVNPLTNPGLYARNECSFEVLRHVEHTVVTGLRNHSLMRGGQYTDGNIGIIYH